MNIKFIEYSNIIQNQMPPKFVSSLLHLILQFQQHILSTHSFVYLCQLFTIIFILNPLFQTSFATFVRTIQSFTLPSNILILLLSLLVLTLQLTSNISFIRIIYLPVYFIFSIDICVINTLSIVICVLALVIDTCKNTNRLCIIRNLESEPFNQIKIGLDVLNILSVFIPSYRMYMIITVTVLYLLLLLIRIKYQVSLKQLQIFQELWCVGAIITLTIKCIIGKNISISLQLVIIITVCGLIGYIVFRVSIMMYKQLNISQNKEQLKRNDQFLPIVSFIFQYLIGPVWDDQTTQKIQRFLYSQEEKVIKISIQNKQEYLLKLYHLAIEHKYYYSNNYQYWSIMYQIECTSRSNIPSMVTILEIIKKIIQQSYTLRYPLRWLEVNKLQQVLRNKIQKINQVEEKQYKPKYQIKLFEINDKFIDKIRVTTKLFVSVWSILREKCSVNHKIDQLIVSKDEVNKLYVQLEADKSRLSTKMYMDYLYYVEKNIDEYYKVYDDFTMSYFPEIDQKIFIEGIYLVLGLEGQIVQVSNSNLLGYNKQQLQKNNLQILLPPFIKHAHHHWVTKYFDQIQNEHLLQTRITRFNKSTFCIDRQGNLKQIYIMFGLCLIQNEVRMGGVVRVKDNKCLAFNKETQKIVGSSEALNMLISNVDVIPSVKYDITGQESISKQIKVMTSIENIEENEQYTLFKKILVDKQEIWILTSEKHDNKQNQSFVIMAHRSKQSVIPSQNKKLSSKTEDFIFKKQEMETKTYAVKKLVIKLSIVFVIFCLFSVILTFLFINHSNIFSERIKYSQEIEIIQLSSIRSNTLINFVYYLDFIVKQNFTLHALNYTNTQVYQSSISYIKTLYHILQQYPSYTIQQQFNETSHYSNSLLLFKTLIVSIDWLVTDFNSGDIINSVEEIMHIQNNSKKIGEIIGYYEEIMLGNKERFERLRWREFIITVCITTLTTVFGIVLLIFDIKIVKENIILNNLLLGLDPMQLSACIGDCFSFLKLTYSKVTTKQDNKINNSSNWMNNSQNSRMFTQMSLLQNSIVINPTDSVQCDNNNNRLQTQTDQILIPVEFEQSKCKASKLFIIILVIVVVSIEGVIIGSYHLSKYNQIPIQRLMESASALRSQYGVYMSIHLQLLGAISNNSQLETLKQKIDNYNTKVNKQLQNYSSQVFDHEYFSKFKEMKNSLDFARMCDYQECSQYGGLLNTSYSSSVLSAIKYVQEIYQARLKSNLPLPMTELKAHQHIECLVYVSEYYTKLFLKVMGEMMNSIQMYLRHLNKMESIMYYIMIAQWGIMMGMVGWITWKMVRSRNRACKILALFNTKLYTLRM